ncbi:hypothetical protein Q7M48_05055 [Candidatus Liberibacter asiaticus]|uniref:hypothetical protein n=3 Tax=Liberibacter asiaticus TaxID=34021 RepID=UPI00018351BA|nr:hypothetical protein [Candidatus Liberibacter asiaticus]ALK07651.2 hypothetical protein CD16_05070 [Candidatus Liberibacter asiaticus]KAE9509659.1 hypothetical protein FXW22_04990 [Candidatus Liberibacter asiaticus]KAE9511509.1 hypothetical protein FXW31_01105 [Candidatus Liberibacter asiaticus]KAE9511805.1 hypothetical protein FXW32_04975 [Candidatus Liberibacter asiaticus]KAE9512904.1 hypothetical protein FXW35_04785 [Candidatus Liberibacter asiaticus]
MGKQRASLAPDPKAIASLQLSANLANASANAYRENIDRMTPDGIWQYKTSGVDKIIDSFIGREISIPHYLQSYSLHPIQQQIHNRQNINNLLLSDLLTQRIQDLLPHHHTHVNTTKDFPPQQLRDNDVPEKPNASLEERKEILYNYPTMGSQQYEKAFLDRLQSSLQQDREDLETKLHNQGLVSGSVAWNRAIDETNRKLHDVRLAAMLKASDEQERLDNIQEKHAYFHNLAQAQGLQ